MLIWYITMATITHLSDEVISIILGYVDISIRDVVNFSSTCKLFRGMIHDDNMLWRNKFYRRWPNLKRIYDKRKCKEHINFQEETIASAKCRKELWCYVMKMPKMHYYQDDLSDSDMKGFDSLFHLDKGVHNMNYHFLRDEITSSLSWIKNLTHRYYIKKLLRHLQQWHLKNIYQEFRNYSDKQQLLEQAATIVAKWCQPKKYVSYSHIKASLANIAQQVLECLKIKHPMHPIFSTSAELFSFWEHNDIDDNQWNRKEGKQIIDMLREVLFDRIRFSGDRWFLLNPGYVDEKYVFIDRVLKERCGNNICLSIIFQSVARRLGLRCDLISFPSHFFLSWKSKYNTTNPEDEECFYIDVLHGGYLLGRNDCPRIRGAKKCPIENFNAYNKISPTEVMLRMINYLHRINHSSTDMRSLLELQHLIDPTNIDTIAQLGHYYVQHRMDLSDIMVKLIEIQNNCKNISAEVMRAEMLLNKFSKYPAEMPCNKTRRKQRTKEMKFKVGMCVTCHFSHHSLRGVIIGWDEKFNLHVAMKLKESACQHSGTNPQPFYKVLCTDDKVYYVIEDDIRHIEDYPTWGVISKYIGRHFCEFKSGEDYYVPNEVLAEHYPCDLQ